MVAARVGTNVATHAKLMPTSVASRVGTLVATHARLVPTCVAARVGTDVATQAKPVPTLRPSKTHANFWLCKSRANVRPGEGVDS